MQLKVDHLSKSYGPTVALNDIAIEFEIGLTGLLGPNGAGKSTLIRTLATLQKPDSGDVLLDGRSVISNPLPMRQTLGYLPQDFGVYDGLSARFLLDYLAQLKGITSPAQRDQRVAEVLELTHLSEVAHRSVSTYSGGMKQRFGLAQSLLNHPQILIADEPLAGLDPGERRRCLSILQKVAETSIVIFSTHIVDDIQALCKNLIIIDKGDVKLASPTEKAISELDGKVWNIDVTGNEAKGLEGDVLSYSYPAPSTKRYRVYSELKPDGGEPTSPILEDVYFLNIDRDSA
jgi:ABC-type multidrug transport system ATPase subunit